MTLYLLLGLFIGFVLGWVGQRSSFCIQGAIRDLFLLKDRFMLWGVLAAMLAFSLVNLFGFKYEP